MAIKLNLLPPGAGVTGTVGKFLRITRTLGVIAVAFFLVFTLGISAILIFSTISLNGLKNDTTSLGVQIQALQSTETQAVLLKDRISKIRVVSGLPSAIKNLDSVNLFFSNLSPTTSLNELDVDSQKVDASIVFTSTKDLSAFIKVLSGVKGFNSVILTSFGYSPSSGYLLGVRLNNQ